MVCAERVLAPTANSCENAIMILWTGFNRLMEARASGPTYLLTKRPSSIDLKSWANKVVSIAGNANFRSCRNVKSRPILF